MSRGRRQGAGRPREIQVPKAKLEVLHLLPSGLRWIETKPLDKDEPNAVTQLSPKNAFRLKEQTTIPKRR